MSKTPHDKVLLPNGVGRTPLGSKEDDPESAKKNAIVDLVICVRGQTPNRDLGYADRFLSTGEWGLAMQAISAVLEDDFPLQSEWIAAAYDRADRLLPADSEGRRR